MKTKPNKVVELLEMLTEELRKETEAQPGPVYYDQTNSPLPRETHCRLVRSGKLTGFKVAGRILVKRDEMHSFIESFKVEPHIPLTDDDEAVVAAALGMHGIKRAG
jgi:hypothetical protein